MSGGLSFSPEKILISDEPPPTGTIPAWAKAILQKQRRARPASVTMAYPMATSYQTNKP